MALLADLLTFLRLAISVAIVTLGLVLGLKSFRGVILLLLAGWTTDILDGNLARKAVAETSLGRFDFLFDVIMILASFYYFVLVKLVSLNHFLLYTVAIALVYLFTRSKSLVMLAICPLSFLPYYFALHVDRVSAFIAVFWAVMMLVLDKKRFFGVIAEFAEEFPGGYLRSTAEFFEKLSRGSH